VETKGAGGGKGGAPPRLEAGWPCRRGKEEKGIHRAVEKAAGGPNAPLYLSGLVDGRAPTSCLMWQAVRVATGPLNRIP